MVAFADAPSAAAAKTAPYRAAGLIAATSLTRPLDRLLGTMAPAEPAIQANADQRTLRIKNGEAITETRPCWAHASDATSLTCRMCARSPRNAATAAAITASVSSVISSRRSGGPAGAVAARGSGAVGAAAAVQFHLPGSKDPPHVADRGIAARNDDVCAVPELAGQAREFRQGPRQL